MIGLAALLARVAVAATWDALGPVEAPERVLSETVHPEFVRVEVEGTALLPRYWMEISEDKGGAFCTAGGLGLNVRLRLDPGPESFELDPAPPAVTLACERLAVAAPRLREAMASARGGSEALDARRAGPDGVPTGQPESVRVDDGVAVTAPARVIAEWRLRPFHAVVVGWAAAFTAWLVAGLAAWFRELRASKEGDGWEARVPIGATFLAMGAAGAVAVATRVRQPATTLLGGDAAYERLLTALGRSAPDRYYGETWSSLYGLISQLRAAVEGNVQGSTTAFVHDANRCASVATCVLLALVARRLGLGVGASTAAGVLLAVWPLARNLSAMEDHMVLVAALQALTLAAALGPGRLDRAVAVASAVLLGHLRPEQLPVAALLLTPLLGPRAWGWLALGGAGLLSRLAYFPESTGSSPITWSRYLDSSGWSEMASAHLLPAGLALPVALPLAALGVWSTARRAPIPALALLVSLAIYLPKSQPLADPMRFSLPTVTWLALLAVAGLRALWMFHVEQGPPWPRAVAILGGLGLLRGLPVGETGRPWGWESEYAFLVSHLSPAAVEARATAGLPPATDVLEGAWADGPRGWYDASQDPNAALGRWLYLQTSLRWADWGEGVPAAGDLVYRGTADRLHPEGEWKGGRCGLDVLAESEVASASDGWVDFGPQPLRLALYRVADCGGLAPQ